MEWDFEDNELAKLYENGKSRKFRGLPRQVLENFIARIGEIDAATTIYDLRVKPSLNFKKLSGKKKNIYSIRVNRKWRLEFRVDWDDEEKTRGFFYITELSNHYGD